MRSSTQTTVTLGFFAGLTLAAASLAEEVLPVKITNNGTQDILVSVYDMSTTPARVILSHERITGFTSIPIAVATDDSGRVTLSWTATSSDRGQRRCGQADNVRVAEFADLKVGADGSCGT